MRAHIFLCMLAYYVEWHTGLSQVFQANLISLVCQGVFVKFPKLKVVMTECGTSWLMRSALLPSMGAEVAQPDGEAGHTPFELLELADVDGGDPVAEVLDHRRRLRGCG